MGSWKIIWKDAQTFSQEDTDTLNTLNTDTLKYQFHL